MLLAALLLLVSAVLIVFGATGAVGQELVKSVLEEKIMGDDIKVRQTQQRYSSTAGQISTAAGQHSQPTSPHEQTAAACACIVDAEGHVAGSPQCGQGIPSVASSNAIHR